MTKEITKVELFCDDNSVGAIQRMLSRVKGVYDVRAVPVVNAEVKANGHVQAVTDGNLLSQLTVFIAGREQITPKETKAWLASVGKSPTSSTYILQEGVKARLLAKRGHSSNTVYLVRAKK